MINLNEVLSAMQAMATSSFNYLEYLRLVFSNPLTAVCYVYSIQLFVTLFTIIVPVTVAEVLSIIEGIKEIRVLKANN